MKMKERAKILTPLSLNIDSKGFFTKLINEAEMVNA
jgi:hypothetical protein